MAQWTNYNNIPRIDLVWEWLLNWDATDTAWSNNWTATNVTWLWAEKWYVSEVWDFNGTSAWISDSSATLWLNAYTCSIWLNSDVAQSGATRRAFWLYTSWISAGALNFQWDNPTAWKEQAWEIATTVATFYRKQYTTSLTNWTWYHLACTYTWWSNWTLEIYLNWVSE